MAQWHGSNCSNQHWIIIPRYSLYSLPQDDILVSGYVCAEGLAWDWIRQQLYWTDSALNKIEVFDPATGYRKTLHNTGLNSNPADIVVDPNKG